MIRWLWIVVVAAAETQELTRSQRALAATTACITGAVTTLPIDAVKTRVQASRTSVVAAAARILKTDGLAGFYRGLAPALLMTPGSIVQYTIYDELRSRQCSTIVAATLAGIVDITIRTPFEKLKTVAQAGSLASPQAIAYNIRSLWAGYGATLMRDVPYVCIYWTTYDAAKGLVDIDNPTLKGFVAGFIAGAVAASLCTPFDVVKTRIQTAPPGLTPFSTLSTLVRSEGIAYLFAGLPARLVRIPVYTGVVLATFETAKLYLGGGELKP